MAQDKSTKDKSILDKFTETMKGLADSASQALKAEEPARADETSAAYMPLAAEGLVSDPLLVPPMASQPARRKKRPATKSAPRTAVKAARKRPAKRGAKKSAAKAKTPARARARAAASKSSRKTSRKTAKRASKRNAVRRGGR